MIDNKQKDHFKSEKNRYAKNRILYPPKHTQEEVFQILDELHRRNIQKVVEFGSGNGRLTIPLLRRDIHVVAVDVSTESLASLRQTTTDLTMNKKMLVTSQTLPQEKTDAIVGCDILHHVDIHYYFKEMKNRLNDKGIIIFSEPNILNIAWPLLITFTIDWRIEWRIIFCNYFTLMIQLRKIGFKNIHIKGHGLFPPPLFNSFPHLQKVNYVLGNLPILKLFAYRFIIIATV